MGILEAAFNNVLNLHHRNMKIQRNERNGTITGPFDIKVTPSNYYRHLSGPEEITITGREFVISKNSLDSIGWGIPRKGDRLIDTDLSESIISEARQMFDLGGDIIGYRCRSS